jgi:uncharacterized BrkB/YihY/UPF0761 family membrane protein
MVKNISKDNIIGKIQKNKDLRDKFYAKIAFFLSLGFWIPLFNIALCIISIIIAVIALKKYYQEPDKFGGLGYVIAALIISLTGIVLTIVGLIIFFNSDQICGSAICRSLTSQ